MSKEIALTSFALSKARFMNSLKIIDFKKNFRKMGSLSKTHDYPKARLTSLICISIIFIHICTPAIMVPDAQLITRDLKHVSSVALR